MLNITRNQGNANLSDNIPFYTHEFGEKFDNMKS